MQEESELGEWQIWAPFNSYPHASKLDIFYQKNKYLNALVN